ncbi:MAG: nicotinate phosphoribosyltransferase, partial [Bradyrhizobium sp.]|nr:nicotinate phosphoribosyltransferase [Bradyrhizobium sp.]
TGRFRRNLLDFLADYRFTGDVHAIAEGTAVFGEEPMLRVTAPLPQAQLLESRLVNILHYQTVVASKAARMVLAAPGKLLLDFGMRSAHGAEAGLLAARASYIAGFAGTATVLAGLQFGIPIFGTMAHSYILAHDDEMQAFEDFARARPDNLTLLIDSYDTLAGARKVVTLARNLAADGIVVRGVRIDSGDLIALSKEVRRILDDGGLREVQIFVSGGIDEDVLAAMAKAGAPIGGFGIGTNLTVSSDAPTIDCAYKLQEYAGLARRKRSTGKETWPGRKQVWRHLGADERMAGDVLSIDGDAQDGTALVLPVIKAGQRLAQPLALETIRQKAAATLAALPESLRRLDPGFHYPVIPAEPLRQLAEAVDRRGR